VRPDFSASDESYWREKGVIMIRGYGNHFLARIKAKLIEEDILPSGEFIDTLENERGKIYKAHFERDQQEATGAFLSAMYQNGLMHALDEVLERTRIGTDKSEFEQALSESQQLVADIRVKQLADPKNPDLAIEVGYHSGRLVVYEIFLARKGIPIPPYFDPYELQPSLQYVKGESWSD
jgi:hypothetical protein